MNISSEEFAVLANEKFGDKVNYNVLTIPDDVLSGYNKERGTAFIKEDFENYGKHVWLIGKTCPNCNSDLLGLFGSFNWGIVHGYGNCCDCGTEFKYYHYIKENSEPIELFELTGF